MQKNYNIFYGLQPMLKIVMVSWEAGMGLYEQNNLVNVFGVDNIQGKQSMYKSSGAKTVAGCLGEWATLLLAETPASLFYYIPCAVDSNNTILSKAFFIQRCAI